MRGWADLALVAIALIWGGTFVTVKRALDDCSPILFLAIRFSLASAVMAAVFARRLGSWRHFGPGLAPGVALGVSYIFQTVGLKTTTASKSAFLTGLYIVLVPLLAAIVQRSVPRWGEAAGVLCSSIGMALMTLDGGWTGVSVGDGLTLIAAFAAAVQILLLARVASSGSGVAISLGQVATVAVLCWPLAFLAESPRVTWSAYLIGSVIALGVLATALVFALQTWALKHTTPLRMALIFALEPVFGALIAYLAAGERLSGAAVAGAGLILGGIVLVELKPEAPVRHLQG
jgi:drug/metabolite transporter (DMT)-like permease